MQTQTTDTKREKEKKPGQAILSPTVHCHQPGCSELKRIKIPRNQSRAGVRDGVRCGMIDFDGSHHRKTQFSMFLAKNDY